MLKVDFLNVGKGNCTTILHPTGRLSVIDIDNSRITDENDTLQCPIDFIRNQFPNKDIFRFILTHPDLDHMSGLAELIKHKTIYNFWDTGHDKEIEEDKLHLGGYSKDDWNAYLELRKSASNPKSLQILRNHSRDYWNEDNIEILSPSTNMLDLSKNAKDNDQHKYNHLSYVLKIQYKGISILFGGDATVEAWQDIYDHYGAAKLKANVFLAPHHGSPANINEDVFAHINPDFVVVSDHRGHKYDYSFYNSLAKKQVYSTKHFGNISITINPDGKGIITPEKNV